MNCPKCNEGMRHESHQGVEIDRCPDCNGIWLDQGEVDKLLATKLANLVDKGEIKEAANSTEAHCHRCDKPMFPKSGLAHVRFDYCIECRSMFLDGGELTALHEFKAELERMK